MCCAVGRTPAVQRRRVWGFARARSILGSGGSGAGPGARTAGGLDAACRKGAQGLHEPVMGPGRRLLQRKDGGGGG